MKGMIGFEVELLWILN